MCRVASTLLLLATCAAPLRLPCDALKVRRSSYIHSESSLGDETRGISSHMVGVMMVGSRVDEQDAVPQLLKYQHGELWPAVLAAAASVLRLLSAMLSSSSSSATSAGATLSDSQAAASWARATAVRCRAMTVWRSSTRRCASIGLPAAIAGGQRQRQRGGAAGGGSGGGRAAGGARRRWQGRSGGGQQAAAAAAERREGRGGAWGVAAPC